MSGESADSLRIPSLRPGYRLQWESAQNSHVLLYPEGMIRLNPPAAAILSRCDGQLSIGELIAALTAEYPDETGLAEDVHEFLDTARQHGWIELR
jgi:pyrroloquinoline quinone biosynthesis protein D